MIAWTKAIHILALATWCAGLLVLPGLYVRRNGLHGRELAELQRNARFIFIAIVSPAALLTIFAGMLLVFLADLFTVWMAVKLLAVGMLVALHVRQGYVILRVFDDASSYAPWRCGAAIGATLATIGTILGLVLTKPHLDAAAVPAWLREPGRLQSLLEIDIPIP
jgi:protoporphyrinogen IX oxidase